MYSNVTMANMESSIIVIFQYQFMVASIYCQVVELEPENYIKEMEGQFQ